MSKIQAFALVLAVASCATTITTVVIFGMELRSLRANERQDINTVSNHLMSVETQQQQTQQHVQTLTKIVSQTLNATDEYINNITSTVTEAKQTISEDINAVQDIKDNQNTLFAVQFAGYVLESSSLMRHSRCLTNNISHFLPCGLRDPLKCKDVHNIGHVGQRISPFSTLEAHVQPPGAAKDLRNNMDDSNIFAVELALTCVRDRGAVFADHTRILRELLHLHISFVPD